MEKTLSLTFDDGPDEGWHTLGGRQPGYRLDRFDGDGR